MLEEHLGYVADQVRLDQFQTAIAKTIKYGDYVADLGCGSGILGLLCLQAGATKVFAIDSTAMIEVARETLTRAGFSNRAVFIQGHSYRVELPEPVDVVICDHVGYFGFDYGIVDTLQDARRRFLKPGGCLIPSQLRLQLAAVESEVCRAKAEGWKGESVPVEFHWLHKHTVNTKHAVSLPREALLSAPAELGDIDLHADNPDFLSWTAEWQMTRDGVMHGLVGWFECELAQGVWMTNSPLSDHAIQRPQAFLPIEEAVSVKTGDLVKVKIMTRPADHLISWVVEMPAAGRRFSQSTWRGMLLGSEDLHRSHPTRVPRLSRAGKARTAVLAYCDGRRTAQEIEQAVLHDHPDLFPSPEEISRFIAQTLSRDTE